MKTLVSVHCYQGDAELVRRHLPVYEHHGHPIVILSPKDSPVSPMGNHICAFVGKRAYIGQDSLDRQIEHIRTLLSYPFDFYFLCDADSFCVSPELPSELYAYKNTLFSNHVGEPRPHASPYPKIACQPPYFCSRGTLEKLVAVAPAIRAHPVTPYLDWAMLAWGCETGITHRAFHELEKQSPEPFTGTDPWDTLRFRIERQGAIFMHPIKTAEQLHLCQESYAKRIR